MSSRSEEYSPNDKTMTYNIKEILKSIHTINQQTKLAQSKEHNDFNYSILHQLNKDCQKALWHLSNGTHGEPNQLNPHYKRKHIAQPQLSIPKL